MRIGIDISPLSSGHKVRGVGSYVTLIKNNIQKFDSKNDYVFFEGKVPLGLDLVHYPYFDPFYRMLPLKKSVKTVVTVHDLIPIVHKINFPSGIKAKFRWEINKRLLSRVDRIVVDSEATKIQVQKQIGISSINIDVVYLAADPIYRKLKDKSFIKDIQKNYNLPDDFFLYVGDATWNKNIPRLINAIKKSNKTLVMVGKVWDKHNDNDNDRISNNPWNKDLNESLELIRNHDNFIRLGYLSSEDVVRIYNMATALVFPSRDEGFGLPLLEAMSCGCPVIVGNIGSLREIGGNSVLYVDCNSTDSIADGIIRISNSKKEQIKLSQLGIKRASEFSIEKTIRDLVTTYSSLK